MGLRSGLSGLAVARLHVLVVEVPGFWRVRIAMERAIALRGWCRALSPAEADALVVCGAPGHALSEAIELTWDQLPGPRARVDVPSEEAIPAALQTIKTVLLDPHPEVRRTPEPPAARHNDTVAHGDLPHAGMNHGDPNHAGMDHGGMQMAPAGIALARGADDRDGLRMDALRILLGPVLPYWPAGLVLRCVLHGDVIADAAPEILPAASFPDPAIESSALRAARTCAVAADVLALAGWPTAAASARRIVSGLVAGEDHAAAARDLARLQRQVGRSYLLRWSLRGIGPLTARQLSDYELPDHLLGDVYDRLISALSRAQRELEGNRSEIDRPMMHAVPLLVTGLDVAAARLVVASLGLDTASLVAGRP